MKKEKELQEKELQEKNENANNETAKIKFSEKMALKFKKIIMIDTFRTILTVAILFVSYIALNLWASEADLPKIDVTENQIYTLTDASKKALETIDQDVKLYAYGFEENSTFIDLLKQYNKANEKITYEVLTEESNLEMVTKYDLSGGYYALIIKSGDSEKFINPSTEFSSYDYTTYQTIDTTEQTITNSILSLNIENKPKIYLTEGHNEYDATSIARFVAQLNNEAYEVEFVNLATTGMVPEDCDILAIISPAQDFHDVEVTAITNYINNGGDMYFSTDVISQDLQLTNLQKILDLYGVNVENGYIFECTKNQYLANYNYIFMPQVSSSSEITREIYTDSFLWLVFSGRLNFKPDEELATLKVTKETLLSSTEQSMFITDLSNEITTAVEKAAADGLRSYDIASAVTKKVIAADGNEKESNLVIVASSSFISDYVVSELNQSYPLSFIGSNIDFSMNSMAFLAGKDNILTIRKEYNNSTYIPTNIEHIVVVSIIIFVPLLIIITGLIVGAWRKRRK